MMTINEFEHGKTRILAAARAELRRIGVEYHCVMFDIHPTEPLPAGATLTVTAEGRSVSGWFPAHEIGDSKERIARAEVQSKIARLVADVKPAIA